MNQQGNVFFFQLTSWKNKKEYTEKLQSSLFAFTLRDARKLSQTYYWSLFLSLARSLYHGDSDEFVLSSKLTWSKKKYAAPAISR